MKKFILAVALVVFASTAFGADVKTSTTVSKAPVQKQLTSVKIVKPVKVKKVKKPIQKQVSSVQKVKK